MVDEVHRSKANHALPENLEKTIGAKLQLLLYTGLHSVQHFGSHDEPRADYELATPMHSSDISASGAIKTQHIPTPMNRCCMLHLAKEPLALSGLQVAAQGDPGQEEAPWAVKSTWMRKP